MVEIAIGKKGYLVECNKIAKCIGEIDIKNLKETDIIEAEIISIKDFDFTVSFIKKDKLEYVSFLKDTLHPKDTSSYFSGFYYIFFNKEDISKFMVFLQSYANKESLRFKEWSNTRSK